MTKLEADAVQRALSSLGLHAYVQSVVSDHSNGYAVRVTVGDQPKIFYDVPTAERFVALHRGEPEVSSREPA